MTILTGRELEVLTGLQMSWGKLYSKELARLQNKDDPKCAIDPSSHTRVVWPWAFLKDRALANGELLATRITLPEAVDRLAFRVALRRLGGLGSQPIGLTYDAAMWARLRLAARPHDAL